MNNYLLDTCILSETNKQKPDSKVLNWLYAHNDSIFYISVLSIGEIQKGISRLAKSNKKSELQKWLNIHILQEFYNETLNVDTSVITHWSKLIAKQESIGKSMSIIDSLIVATAITHNLTIITRNIKDMQVDGVKIVNPYE
jgi:predicted nucleic acid-binding protein